MKKYGLLIVAFLTAFSMSAFSQNVVNTNILSYSGWETGKLQSRSSLIDGWGAQLAPGHEAESASVVSAPTAPVRAGSKSMRIYYHSTWPLREGKIRTELLTPAGLRLDEGKEYWIGFSVYLKDTPNNRNAINGKIINNHVAQWHLTSPTDPFPGTSGINMRNGLWQVSFGKLGEQAITAKPIQLGKWTDFVFHVKVSKDPAVGFMQMWINKKATDTPDVNRKGATSNGFALSQKIGIYRGYPWTLNNTTYAEQYHDEYRLGNAKAGFAAVAPGSNNTPR
jgi:Polysaccharide lyase